MNWYYKPQDEPKAMLYSIDNRVIFMARCLCLLISVRYRATVVRDAER